MHPITSVLPTLAPMNKRSFANLYLCILTGFGMANVYGQQPSLPPATPHVIASVLRSLTNTAWTWTNLKDRIVIGGAVVIKDGAWLSVRFRSGGTFSAWHGNKIFWEGRWEVMGPDIVRIPNRGTLGLVLKFDAAMTTFTVANEEVTSGKLIGQVPLDPVVGRWSWPRGGVVRLREDGRAFGEWRDAKPGVWHPLGKEKYEIVWDGGKITDTIRIMSGDNKLDCENQNRSQWKAPRVVNPPAR